MQIKNRNLFRLTRFILLKFPVLFKTFAANRPPLKRLLIIKTDAIGDYILFRNFIGIVKASALYKDYEIHLLGNELWSEIAERCEPGFVSRFYFVKPGILYESPFKTWKLAFTLFDNNYDVVLQPSFSRTFIADGLAGFTAAKRIVGFTGDCERITPKYKNTTDGFYTRLLPDLPGLAFEFERSRFFFETVLEQPISLKQPFIDGATRRKMGIVIAIGAGVSERSWETEKFIEVIRQLFKITSERITLAGGKEDIDKAKEITEKFGPGAVDNLAGKTSLNQLIDLIAGSRLLIGNESAAVHIAAAVGTASVCIAGGGHFGRFVPYNAPAVDAPVCVSYKMDCYNCNWQCRFELAPGEPYPCIANINVQDVLKAVQAFL
jgi:ADP-heptose:LPS heptosyltransferase